MLPEAWLERVRGCFFNACRLVPVEVEWWVNDYELVPVSCLGFHGTPRDNLVTIRQQGLKPSAQGHLGSGVYLASHLGQAVEYCCRHTFTGRERTFRILMIKHKGRGDKVRRMSCDPDDHATRARWAPYDPEGRTFSQRSDMFEMCVPVRDVQILGILTVRGVRPRLNLDHLIALEDLLLRHGSAAAQKRLLAPLQERHHETLFTLSRRKRAPFALRKVTHELKHRWQTLWTNLFHL